MNIAYKCKCGRTTTYGLKCVACAGLTLDFIKRNSEEPDEEDEEVDPKPLDDSTVRKSK